MGYLIFTVGGVIGIGLMLISATDYKSFMTNIYATKKPMSFGIKSISGSVRQLRFWYFFIGVVATLISAVGIVSLLNS